MVTSDIVLPKYLTIIMQGLTFHDSKIAVRGADSNKHSPFF